MSSDDPIVRSTLANVGQKFFFQACLNCALVFREPRPTAAHLAQYYEKVLPTLEPGIMAKMGVTREQADRRNAVRYRSLFELLRPLAPEHFGHVVDVGGWDGAALIPWRNAGWRATLIEPGGKLRQLADPEIRAVESAREAVDLQVAKADILTSYHCVEHLLQIEPWLADVRLLSKPGSLWLIEVPFDLLFVRGLLGPSRLREANVHPEHLNFFTPESLRWIARLAGLRTLEVGIAITPYWFGPTVSLRLFARHEATDTPIPKVSRRHSPLALRAKLSLRFPIWRRVAGVKFRYHRLRHSD